MMADDDYNRKMEALQLYIPFLENMITQLKDPNRKNREQQLTKMESLLTMITDKRKKLKLETLVRCEDVISKLYEKVHNRPISQCSKQNFDSPFSTPASPSPTRDVLNPRPLTIPTERLVDSRIPRIDVYNSAAESLSKPRVSRGLTLGGKLPDMSKPPISLEDLKTLEEDVQDKINETCLNGASLHELRNLKDMIEEQLVIENIKANSPEKSKLEQTINTTARNSLSLSKMVIQPPEKPKTIQPPEKPKAIQPPEKPKVVQTPEKTKVNQPPDKAKVSQPTDKPKVKEALLEVPKANSSSKTKDAVEHSPPKIESKSPPAPSIAVKPKILKEPASIFGSILSNIDGQILGGKKKKEERRSSITGKDDKGGKSHRRSSTSKDDSSSDSKKKEDKKVASKDENKPDEKKKDSGDKTKSSSKDIKMKERTFDISGKKSVEALEKQLKQKIESKEKDCTNTKDSDNAKDKNADKVDANKNKSKEDSLKDIVGTIGVRKEHELKEVKEDSSKTFKRLADKYNPKPKKTNAEADVSKVVADSIELNMKASPPKIPLINQLPLPVPPPASLVRCSQAEPENPALSSQFPAVLQNIMLPSTTQLINSVVSQLRQSNAEADAMKKGLLPTPLLPTPPRPLLPTPPLPLQTPPLPLQTPPLPTVPPPAQLMSPKDSFVSGYAREDNFTSDYVRDNFKHNEFLPGNMPHGDFNTAHVRQRYETLNFEPPPTPDINQFIPNSPRYIPPLIGDSRFNDSFSQNRQFPAPHHQFPQTYNNFNQNPPIDIQPLDYYPPNAPMPTNPYNGGPPLLSPEVPHYHMEEKPNAFGMMPGTPHYGYNDDMQWRPEDNRPYWDVNRPSSRDPRTYREYREMRESRDPRVARDNSRDPRISRDPRENRDKDPREHRDREPRENRDRDPRENRERDPRLNRDRDRESRDRDNDRSRSRDSRSQNRDYRPSRYDSKFDRMYSRNNRERSGSRSRSRAYSKDTFASPLDSLYTGKEEHKTGKGYGVQHFRIPRIKKEDEEDKDQSTKVTSTNEELTEAEVTEEVPDTTNDDEAESDVELVETKSVDAVKADESKEVKEVTEIEVEAAVEAAEPSKIEKQPEPEQIEKPAEPEAKPADQTILAQFFANLLGSQNKRDKKTALYSLISTFSDSFSQKELTKITKIIKANDEDEEGTSEEEEEEHISEETKKAEEKTVEESKQENKDQTPEKEPEGEMIKEPKGKPRRRIRRISSSALAKEDHSKEEETAKSPERHVEEHTAEENNVIVTVGERIKSRKRASSTPQKPKKKCKTELDLLHEDIQDMFIRDGVLTASGKRMCRLLKDDPNVLTTQAVSSEQSQKIRKKPGPKPKPKPPNAAEVKAMKSVRVVISKIPDAKIVDEKEDTRRNLRRSNRKLTYAESDDESPHLSPKRQDSVADAEAAIEEEPVREEESEAEMSDTDKEKTPQTGDAQKSKMGKRKRGKGWASGVIPNKKKKKKAASAEESAETPKNDSPTSDKESDKSFVEPDKNYYLDYATRKQHDCKLCNYHGRFITTHYKTSHPDSEVLTSRFSPAVAAEAIKDSDCNLAKYEAIVRNKGGTRYHYVCRICNFSTHVLPTLFYDHITTHTGEYRHICNLCEFSSSNGKTLKGHMRMIHDQPKSRIVRKSYGYTIVFGYMCGECNFVQMDEKAVAEHINIFHLEKPIVYKVNMSKILDPETEKTAEDVGNESFASSKSTDDEKVEEVPEKEEVDDSTIQEAAEDMPPPPKKTPRQKPGPKCSKKKIPADVSSKKNVESDVTDTESVTSTNSEESNPVSEKKVIKIAKRRLTREVSSEEEPVQTVGRSRRAAKDKATEKLKFLMENNEAASKKKTSADEAVKEKPKDKVKKDDVDNKTDAKSMKTDEATVEVNKPVEEEVKSAPKEVKSAPKEVKSAPEEVKSEEIKCKVKPAEELKPAIVKKEVEMNVFTCKTDLLEENKKIERERLQLMDELNKSVGSRTSLNFVDKLCNRLSNNDVIVKQEPRDDAFDSVLAREANKPPLVMPVLERSLPSTSAVKPAPEETPPPKKPVLEAGDMQVSPNFDVTQKNDKVITDMIQKLKGKLGNLTEDNVGSPATLEDNDYDSEGPPPLTHVNELVNVKPSDGNTKTLLIGDLLMVIKNSDSLTFSCLVSPCVFATENRETFQAHCRDAHKQYNLNRNSTLCEMCGMEVTATDCTLLENLFKHTITEHADFINDPPPVEDVFVKPPSRVLRIRKLSGDALSIKKDFEEELDKAAENAVEAETNKENQNTAVEVQVSEAVQEEPPVSMAELSTSEENPFPFKIAGVMSLAEPQPPPLAPIAKAPMQLSPTNQLVVKEAKLTQAELNKTKKSQKAMARFLSNISELYKCPHYYCLFTTNYREFLDRHLKTHQAEHDAWVPCVYCDMKTPWEHIPMHIDIRHAHCRFACNYCLYRAVIKEYVFLHQDQAHPKSDYSVIALPQPKHSRRFAIADVKIDAKSICEPYQCSKSCKQIFLFENEFRRHLSEVHTNTFLPCGHKNCTNRVQANKMISHWFLAHGISIYQCGYCKMSSNEMKDMYHHVAKMHQGQHPNILIRVLTPLRDGVYLGYTQEAFSSLRAVVTVPQNLLEDKNSGPLQVDMLTAPPLKPFAKTTLQVVTSAPQSISKGLLIPVSQAGLNRTITLVSTSANSNAGGNILLLPNVDVSGIAMSSQTSIINSVASLGKAVQVVPATKLPVVQGVVTNSEPASQEEKNLESAQDADNIAPLEHITIGEDNAQAALEDAGNVDIDPLSLDTELTEITKTTIVEAYSSEDETQGNKPEKGKKIIKTGLLSYQLFRCAFCDVSCSNSSDFKKHVLRSSTCRELDITKPYVCVHCTKTFKSGYVLVEHIQVHGILRYSCSLCGNKFSTSLQARNHIKTRHNITQTTVTAVNSIKTSLDTDEYVVRPKLVLQPSQDKDAAVNEPCGAAIPGENVYTPDQVDKIPMRHILSSSVKCAICSYSTKVRTNMVRHLHFHLEEKAVSDTAPVNPVPCLEKNEKMFDKMINLASSSHNSSRMGGAKAGESKEKETENFPEFVPTHCRYVCCALGCNYICPEEGNLRHHLLALHVTETSFTCVHCKTDLTPTDADNLIKHFKLHGLQLHKCQYCVFVHYLKHKVEKHVSDAHLDQPVKVITIRCLESEPKDASQEPEATSSQVPPPTLAPSKINKPWRCCMCKYKSGTQEGIQNHVLEKHEIDMQFKCALCSYKTNENETFTDHFKEAHDNQIIDIIYAYRKMEEDKEKEATAFDTTPLWQRDRPRVRHIRGILFDDMSPLMTKSPKKVGKSPSIATSPGPSTSSAPSPVPSTCKSSNLDLSIESVVNGTADILNQESSATVSDDFFETVNKLVKDSVKETTQKDDVIVIDDEDDKGTPLTKNKDNKDSPMAKNRGLKRKGPETHAGPGKATKSSDEVIDLDSCSDPENDEYSERNLKLQFGLFGTPLNRQLKCPVCNQFKSKRISDFIFHLYKEMKVYRFKCKICSDESITYRYMYKHVQEHNRSDDCSESIISLPPNRKLEAWLQMVIREQSLVILQNFTPTPDSVITNKETAVTCSHCNKKFPSEAEKNEHGIVHWSLMPYGCNRCKFSSYGANNVEKHFETHVMKVKFSVLAIAPTVVKELKLADDLHKSEAQGKESPRVVEEVLEVSNIGQEAAPADVEGELSENDLVIVTKTDSNVPSDGDIFCCEYCPFMTQSEMQVIGHITSCHSHMHVRFKTLNRTLYESNVKDYVGCMNCDEYGSEIKIRQHHMEKHDGLTFMIYRYTCALCEKKCLKLSGLKMHFNRCHPGFPLKYLPHAKSLTEPQPKKTFGPPKPQKCYKCPLCPYSRNFSQNATANLRSHLKQHFKPFLCGICKNMTFRARYDIIAHFAKEHPGEPQQIIHKMSDDFRNLLKTIINDATIVEQSTGTVKNTARKSTSAPHVSPANEYTFYGSEPEPLELHKIMTSVEVNGMSLNMSAEKLTKIFDLDAYVCVEDCNLSVNLSTLFDS